VDTPWPSEGGAPLAGLTAPSTAYKRRAWLAVAALALFMLLYLALAAALLRTAWNLIVLGFSQGESVFWGWLVGLCAAFLAVFMLKSLLFVRRGSLDGLHEITAAQQPELFAFLHDLARRAGAPRPHRVFVSARVNAAVFYDLSLLNLILPSKKNLEIGLGLVNTLSMGELQAVLAHEFGHFGQGAMAVGRWVYVAQQIVGQLIERRDRLDAFINGLARMDVRIAWLGWLLQAAVWAVRALVDTAFAGVVIIQRALNREMEMNADLVAVSLTGSDALIHALHRLQFADDAWGRAEAFARNQLRQGHRVSDILALQASVIELMGPLLQDEQYGRVPPEAQAGNPTHRLFKAELAQPPQMWLTHPLNHEREANAKRRYIAANIDQRSAWVLFRDAQALREQVTAPLLGPVQAETDQPLPTEQALALLRQQFQREFFQPRYQGIYFGRSVVRVAAQPQALYDQPAPASLAALDALYPPALVADMRQLRALGRDLAQLRALRDGVLRPVGGALRYRDQVLSRATLGQTLSQLEQELAGLQARLHAHDRQCRSVHVDVARQIAPDWVGPLRALLAVLHHADHTEANLLDLHGQFQHVLRVAAATRKLSARGMTRELAVANDLQRALHHAHEQARAFELASTLCAGMAGDDLARSLGELKLPMATQANLLDWIAAVDGWVNHCAGAYATLGNNALEHLLRAEATLADHFRQGTAPGAAPHEPVVPRLMAPLVIGAERERRDRVSLWARFQLAQGLWPTAGRLAVAGGVVGSVLLLGATLDAGQLTVYNGLAIPVHVAVNGGPPQRVASLGTATLDLPARQAVRIEARAPAGQVLESFEETVPGAHAQLVYNVAGAMPLVAWTAVYGPDIVRPPERLLGAPRWLASDAQVLFAQPPTTVSSKSGRTRSVLSSLGSAWPQHLLQALDDPAQRQALVRAHARWDSLDSPHVITWLALLASLPTGSAQAVLAERLAEAPRNMLLRRAQQDLASPADKTRLCAEATGAARQQPADLDSLYLSIRCLPDGPDRSRLFTTQHQAHPQHVWLAYGAAWAYSAQQQWAAALQALDTAARGAPTLAPAVAEQSARLRRMLAASQAEAESLTRALPADGPLGTLAELERGTGQASGHPQAYADLAAGRLQQALGRPGASPEQAARLLRLLAASDGARTEWVKQALALPGNQGVDGSTVWSALALAIRQRQDTSAWLAQARSLWGPQAEPVLGFAQALAAGQSAAEAERQLLLVEPALRGQACALGAVVLGNRAPAAWRLAAKRLLFASERPWLS